MSTEVQVLSSSSKLIWKIEDFSDLNFEVVTFSEVFSVGSFKWKVSIYPKGFAEVYDHLSLFLTPVDLTKAVDVQFSFAVGGQADSNFWEKKLEATHEFSNESDGQGWDKFMRLSDLHNPAKGYIVNDTCTITIEVTCTVKEEESKCDDMEVSDPDKDKVPEYPSAGQPFCEGLQHNGKTCFGNDKEFEDVGGFSIFKTQVALYKQIWLKYGHIPTNKVLPISAYALLVMAVKDLMNCIIHMRQCRYVELSSGMMEGWEEMLKMAEKFEFNIGWLRERLESVKKGLGEIQKAKTELLEHGQPLRVAKSRVEAATDELKKAEAELISKKAYLLENVSGLLSESDMEIYLGIGEKFVLDGIF